MQQLPNYGDDRNKGWCVFCGGPMETRGHAPSRVILDEPYPENLPVLPCCDESHSSFHSASEVARVVNSEFTFAAGGEQLAKAVGPGVVEVKLPDEYRNSPVEFVAEMLDVGIDNPHTQARVVVNAKTGVVIVTGEVEISPVIVSHKNLTVEVGGADGLGAGPQRGPFAVVDQQAEVSTRQLKSLLDALDQLRVPPEDIISIIRELHRSGKLHAAYEEF